MTALDEYLANRNGRCEHGHHPAQGQCPECPTDEWVIFKDALRRAQRGVCRHRGLTDELIHQCCVREFITGRIQPKHIGLLYRQAKGERLIREVRREDSNDVRGGNTNKVEPVYELGRAA